MRTKAATTTDKSNQGCSRTTVKIVSIHTPPRRPQNPVLRFVSGLHLGGLDERMVGPRNVRVNGPASTHRVSAEGSMQAAACCKAVAAVPNEILMSPSGQRKTRDQGSRNTSLWLYRSLIVRCGRCERIFRGGASGWVLRT